MKKVTVNEVKQVEPIAGYKGNFIHSSEMTFVYWEIEAGSPLPRHSHQHEQVVNVLEGSFEFTIDEEKIVLNSGDMLVIDSDEIHEGISLTKCKIIDVFCPVREDYRFD